MATYNLRRFAHADGLRAIAKKHMAALLKPYKSYFESRGLTLPLPSTSDSLDYDQLVKVLMNPGTDILKALLNALFFVHEMATPEGLDTLLQEAESNGISLDGKPNPTAADVAVQIYLQDKDLLERKHAEQYLTRPRSFEYFQAELKQIPKLKLPTSKTLASFEKSLDDWYEKKKRDLGSRVFVDPQEDSVWFLVRHGDPMRREGSLVSGQPSSVFCRPEKYDVLVYEPAIGEFRMNACNRGEKDTFRKEFDRHLFKDEDFFDRTANWHHHIPARFNAAAVASTMW